MTSTIIDQTLPDKRYFGALSKAAPSHSLR